MNWPTAQDFNEAVQNPATAFADPDLKAGEAVVGPTGLPMPRSGNFADVYQFRTPSGKDWAVKCFTRHVPGLDDRYRIISAALGRASLPFAVEFTYLEQGVRVRGEWRPVLKMEWVEGLQLNQFVREYAGKPDRLDKLSALWVKLSRRLREAGIAHADVQHGNVLLVDGSRAGSLAVKLIDYDGMFVNELEARPSGELGHPCFQHPLRAVGKVYSANLDRFPELVVAAAVKGVSVLGPGVWEKYDTGDNLLFTEADFKRPAESEVMRELWAAGEPGLRSLVGHLALSCKRPMVQTPWLDELAPDGVAKPLTTAEERAAAEVLGVPPPPVVVPVPPAWVVEGRPVPPTPVVVDAVPLPSSVVAEIVEDTRGRPKKKAGPRKKGKAAGSKRPLAIVAGVMLVLGAAVGGMLAFGGKKPDKATPEREVAKAGEKPAPRPVDPAAQKVFMNPESKEPNPREVPKKVETTPPVTPKAVEPDPVVTAKPPDPAPPVHAAPLPTAEGALKPVWSVRVDEKHGRLMRLSTDDDTRFVVLPTMPSGDPTRPTLSFDADTGAAGPQLPGGRNIDDIYHVSPLARGRVALHRQSAPGEVVVWDIPAGTTTRVGLPNLTSPGNRPFGLVSPDGRFVLNAANPGNGLSGEFRLANAATGAGVASGTWRAGWARFAPDSSRLLLYEADGTAHWYDLPSGRSGGTWAAVGGGYSFPHGVSDGGRTVLIHGKVGGGPDTYSLLDGRTGAAIYSFPVKTYHPRFGHLSRDGRYLAAVRNNGFGIGHSVEVLDRAGKLVGKHAVGNEGASITFGADGRSLFVLSQARRTLTRFEIEPGAEVAAAPPIAKKDAPPAIAAPPKPTGTAHLWSEPTGPGKPAHLAFSADGRTLLVADDDGAVRQYDAASGGRRAVGFDTKSDGKITRLMPLANGLVAVSSSDGRLLRMWDANTGRATGPVRQLSQGAGAATIAVCPTGRYAFVGRHGEKVPAHQDRYKPAAFRVVDLTAGDKDVFAGEWCHGQAAFSGDSSHLLVGETTGRVRWFDVAKGTAEHEFDCRWVSPRRDQDLLSADGTVFLNATAKEEPNERMCAIHRPSGRIIRSLSGDYLSVFGRVSTDGKLAANVSRVPRTNDLRAYATEVTTGIVSAAATFPSGDGFELFAFSPDARRVAVWFQDAARLSVYLLVPTGETEPAIGAPKSPAPKTPAATAPVAPKSLTAVGVKKRWEIDTKSDMIAAMAFDGGGRSVVLASQTKAEFLAFRATNGVKLKTPPPLSSIRTLSPLPGGRVAAHARGKSLLVWDALTGGAATTVALPEVGSSVSGTFGGGLSQDGRYAWAAAFGNAAKPGTLWVNDARTGANLLKAPNGDVAFFTADGARTLIGDRSTGAFRWYKLPTGRADGDLTFPPPSAPHLPCWPIDMSDDGGVLLYTGPFGAEKTGLFTIDPKTGGLLHAFGQNYFDRTACVTPDGRFVVVSPRTPKDGHLELRDSRTGALLGAAKDEFAGLEPFALPALSPDGKMLAAYKGTKLVLYDLTSTDAK